MNLPPPQLAHISHLLDSEISSTPNTRTGRTLWRLKLEQMGEMGGFVEREVSGGCSSVAGVVPVVLFLSAIECLQAVGGMERSWVNWGCMSGRESPEKIRMVSVFLSRIVVLTAGTLYPAYRSYKAVRTKDVREYVKWMMYWIVFAFFCFIETIADVIVSFWLPFYYELKIVFVLWLLSPWTKGASILYRKWVHPTLTKHEKDIDLLLEHAKSESYNQVMRLGSRGILCAREIIATAALRGQAQLVQQLQRSYSTSDINNRELSSSKLIRVTEIQEEDDDHEPDVSDTADGLEEDITRIGEQEERAEALGVRRSSRRRRSPTSETIYNTLPRRTTRQHK